MIAACLSSLLRMSQMSNFGWPAHSIRQNEHSNHHVEQGLGAAGEDVLLIVIFQKGRRFTLNIFPRRDIPDKSRHLLQFETSSLAEQQLEVRRHDSGCDLRALLSFLLLSVDVAAVFFINPNDEQRAGHMIVRSCDHTWKNQPSIQAHQIVNAFNKRILFLFLKSLNLPSTKNQMASGGPVSDSFYELHDFHVGARPQFHFVSKISQIEECNT